MELLTLIFIVFNVLIVIVHLKNLSKVIHIPGKNKQSRFNYYFTIFLRVVFSKSVACEDPLFNEKNFFKS